MTNSNFRHEWKTRLLDLAQTGLARGAPGLDLVHGLLQAGAEFAAERFGSATAAELLRGLADEISGGN